MHLKGGSGPVTFNGIPTTNVPHKGIIENFESCVYKETVIVVVINCLIKLDHCWKHFLTKSQSE